MDHKHQEDLQRLPKDVENTSASEILDNTFIVAQLKINSLSKRYDCEDCNYQSTAEDSLKRNRTECKKRKYFCAHCSYSTISKLELKSHVVCHLARKSFVCKQCDYSTVDKIDYRRHLELHSGEILYRCYDCDYKTTVKRHLKIHLLRHTVRKRTDEKPYCCEQCSLRYALKSDLMHHLKQHNSEMYRCDQCDFKSHVKYHFNRHLVVHTDEKRYHCSQCDFKSAFKYNVTRHFRKLHSAETTDTLTDTDEKSYHCTQCDYTSREEGLLNQHMLVHTVEKPKQCDFKSSLESSLNHTDEKLYSCNQCDFQSRLKHSLSRHLRRHAEKEKLYHCAYKSREESDLKQQMLVHTVEKPERCDFKSSLESSLNHTDEMIYRCDQCDFKSKLKRSLSRHLKRHAEKEKLFNYSLSAYKSREECGLKQEMLVHPVEKPERCDFKSALESSLNRTDEMLYHCNQCNFKSVVKSNYTRHIRRHNAEKIYLCEQCNFKTAFKSSLNQHIKVHTGEKPYHCTECAYKTAHSSCLRRHLQRIHKIFRTVSSVVLKPRRRRNSRYKGIYQCAQCDYETPFKRYLTVHIVSHNNDKYRLKNYVLQSDQVLYCAHCSFQTTVKYDLESHVVTHLNQNSFVCSQFPYTTNSKEGLEEQEKTEQQNFVSHSSCNEEVKGNSFVCSQFPYATNSKEGLEEQEKTEEQNFVPHSSCDEDVKGSEMFLVHPDIVPNVSMMYNSFDFIIKEEKNELVL